MASVIPQGYRLHVFLRFLPEACMAEHKIFEGLSREDAAFRLDLADVLIRGVGLENEFDPSDVKRNRAHTKMLPVFEKHAHLFERAQMEMFRSDVGCMCDIVAERLTGLAPDGYFLLSVDSVLLQDVPEPVVFKEVRFTP